MTTTRIPLTVTLLAMTCCCLGDQGAFTISSHYDRTIPDAGASLGVPLWYGGPLPAGAVVTRVEYALRIDDKGDPDDFRCYDYLVCLTAETHPGSCYDVHRENRSSPVLTDDDQDDDPEDDSDLHFLARECRWDVFEGDPPDQIWYVHVQDCCSGHEGKLDFCALRIWWASPEPVPDVVGMTESDAVAALTAAGFVLGATWWGPSDAPEGTVVTQEPGAGEAALSGSAVDVTLSQSGGGGGGGGGGGEPGPATRLPRARGHWRLDEASGPTAHDSSGNLHDGTLYGNPAWMPTGGMLDGALAFDGIDDYVCVPKEAGLDPESVAVTVWIKPDRADTWMDILNKYSYRLFINAVLPEGRLACQIHPSGGGGSNKPVCMIGWVSAGEWNHVGFTWDALSGLLRTYLNGSETRSRDEQDNNPLVVRAGDVLIGAQSPTRLFFDGLIDDVRIYDVALSAEEVAAVMEGQVAAEPLSGMIAYWPGDGHARDLAGGHDGTLEYGATFAPGVLGQAFAFDGIDDHVRIPYSPDLNPASVTVEAWIKPDCIRWMRIVDSGVYRLAIHEEGKLWSVMYPSSAGGEGFTLRVGSIPAGQWTHVAATWDAPSGRWTLYLNGSDVASDDLEDNNPLISKSAATCIGSLYHYGGGSFFDGLIDEVAIYDRALSGQEILLIYQGLAE